jgi:2-polyprenyl-6-methoxyphenol hydroxylase-like FAD-dependent oxidoreductase
LALDLSCRGVASLVVERTAEVSALPKMNHLNARSMELCRRWKILDAVRSCGWPDDYPMDVSYVTSLAGREIARLAFPSHAARPTSEEIPEPSQRCPQIWFEPLLIEVLAGRPGSEVRRHHELVAFEEKSDGVVAQVRDIATGEEYTVECCYLVGADGAGSTVRRLAGIERESFGPSPKQLAMAVRAKDFWSFHDKQRAAFFIVLDEMGVRSFITPTDGEELWRFNWNLRPGEAAADLDPEEVVRTLAGVDFDFEILGAFEWQVRFTLAERFSAGRVFLAGDAAHTLAPTGGLGLNTGLADAADLGWKLAGTVLGWGGEALLDGYDAERRPACRRIMEESFRNLARLATIPRIPGIDEAGSDADARREGARREIDQGDFRLEWENEGAALGSRYEDSPLIVPEPGSAPAYDPNRYVPTSFPGCRSPHFRLPNGRSTLDLCDDGFALLRVGPTPPDASEILRIAEVCGVPMRAYEISSEEAATRYEHALVLVRPDGYVAWRGDAAPDDPVSLIDRIRGAASQTATGTA